MNERELLQRLDEVFGNIPVVKSVKLFPSSGLTVMPNNEDHIEKHVAATPSPFPTSAPAPVQRFSLIPERVIFQPPATIVYWSDGDKTVVRCENDEFSEEFGYAMACMRKLYGTRAAFKSMFKNAYRPEQKAKKKKKNAAGLLPAPASKKPEVCLDGQLRELAES